MSQWTHIRGAIEFVTSPYEIKGNKKDFEEKDVYLPFPKEQVKLGLPEPYLTYDKKPGIQYEVTVSSLPRAKKYIDEAFKKLPQGETGWGYIISQDSTRCSTSSSDFNHDCEEKEFRRQIVELYNSKYRDNTDSTPFTWKDYKHWDNIKHSWINYLDTMVVGIREDLRYCSGDELLEALEKFFIELRENKVYIEDGYLEWEDEYNSDYIYAWRCSRIDSDINRLYSFMKLDSETNKIIWSKEYRYALDENGKNDYSNIISMEETFEAKENK